MIFLLPLFLTQISFADCRKTWEKENQTNPVVSRCEISAVELVELKSGCALEGGTNERCVILRSCDDKKEIGASVFRKSVSADSYCLSGKEMEVMDSSTKDGPKAFITCLKKSSPQSIRLVSGSQNKNCPFPFKDQP